MLNTNILRQFFHWLGRHHTRTFLYILLIGYGLVTLYPLLQGIFTSFKSFNEIYQGALVPPQTIRWHNYVEAWTKGGFSVYFWNTVLITVLSVVGTIFFSSMAGYVLARHGFWGNSALLMYFLAGLMLPYRLAIIPLFVLLRDLHLLDNLFGLVCAYIGSSIPFSVFIFTNYFKYLPKEIEEAAIIDGASEFRIYLQVLLPLVRPALATVATVVFVWVWNDVFLPLVLIESPEKRTLMLGLNAFFGRYLNQWHLILAGANITLFPVILLYIFASRQFIEGLVHGAGR